MPQNPNMQETIAKRKKKKNKKAKRLLLKWGRLILAIVSSVVLACQPVFNFINEKGLENERVYIMTTRTFEVHHIAFEDGMDKLMGSMSVIGFLYGALAILLGCVVCTLLYNDRHKRILCCTITAFLAGSYYLLMVYYAIRLSKKFFMILYPNWVALLPLVVLITMLSIRKDTIRRMIEAWQKEDEGFPQT